jgi:hypothetical protein
MHLIVIEMLDERTIGTSQYVGVSERSTFPCSYAYQGYVTMPMAVRNALRLTTLF